MRIYYDDVGGNLAHQVNEFAWPIEVVENAAAKYRVKLPEPLDIPDIILDKRQIVEFSSLPYVFTVGEIAVSNFDALLHQSPFSQILPSNHPRDSQDPLSFFRLHRQEMSYRAPGAQP
jgi:hypothetical protein